MSRDRVVLVGSRGVGKSTVGRIVADRLGSPFVDVDDRIEAAVGLPIPSIFETRGEAAFRDAEEEAIRRLTEAPGPAVLATGGGAVVRGENRRRLKRFGLVAWLRAEPGVLAGRLIADEELGKSRPALTPAGAVAEIEAVFEARRAFYREIADLVVDTTAIGPEEAAAAILEEANR